ncbi:MAG: YihY/virulence factor BrkB family protein [Candidatus Limnocylindrales bacterium]
MADDKLGEPGAVRTRQRQAVRADPETTSAEGVDERQARLAPIRRLVGSVLALPPVRRFREIYGIYDAAGGSLLAGGLAYGALFATLTGLLFGVGVLGYLVPRAADRERLVDGFTGQLAPLAPVASDALANLAAHAGAFSLIGLVGMGWGASQFYGSLDTAIGRIFACGTARGALDRILRGIVSVLLLVGGLLSGVAFSTIQAAVTAAIPAGSEGTAGRVLSAVGFPLATAAVVVVAVAVVYRVVPNTDVSWSALGLPALVAGLALTGLTETFVFLAPRLVGALSLFGGFAAVFAALVWLSLAFRVLLMGAAWTWLRECPP